MLRKIFGAASCALVLISIFLIGCTGVFALSEGANGDNPLKIVIEPSMENLELSDEGTELPRREANKSDYPDLGNDQVFPFVAGLDSYE